MQMQKYFRSLLYLLAAIPSVTMALAAPPPSITISPRSATISVSSTVQFTATVTGLPNSRVTWEANGVNGGNSTVGTISTTGLYKSPATVPSGSITITALGSDGRTKGTASVTVTGTSGGPTITSVTPNPIATGSYTIAVAGTGFKSGATVYNGTTALTTTFASSTKLTATGSQTTAGTASIDVANPGTAVGNALSLVFDAPITISPTTATIALGVTQQFTATGATNWTASAGTITSAGLYTAPSTMPSSSSVTITATGPVNSVTAVVTLVAVAAQTISPTTATVVLGGTKQFTSSGATSWTATAGTVSSSGLYTAPYTMPASSTVSVTATGANGSATAIVTLTAAATTSGTVSITTESPYYGWQVIPGATRRIHATIANGSTNEVTWTYTTSGGATATLTPAASPNILGAFVDVTVGSTGSSCTNTGTATAPVFSSSANITLTATSVDDPTKSVTVPIQVCSPTVQVYVSPFNVRLYSGQTVDLQSWVWGAVNDNVVWTVTQPSGGNGAFIAPPAGGSAITNRDAVFSATVTGDYTVTATSVANPSVSASAILSVSSNAMPSYAVTPNHTEPVDCSVDTAQSGKTYDVGSGHAYATLADVYAAIGSNTLSAGTTIRLFNTDTTGINPTRYPEYLRIDGQGTQAAPIRIVGCADSAGNLPILDGSNATAYSSTDNSVAAQIGGLYQISLHHSGTFSVYPTFNAPAYVIIEGLAFRNAYPTIGSTSNFYYAPGSSTATQWPATASCIRPYEGSHVTVRGNDIEDCGWGILADFNGNNAWGGFFGDFDLQGNYFTNIGAANASEHMAYVQVGLPPGHPGQCLRPAQVDLNRSRPENARRSRGRSV